MAVLMINEVNEANQDWYDQVSAKLNVEGDPPEGMIVHTASLMDGGGVRIVDVWESEQQFQSFREARLMPALQEVIGDEATQGPPTAKFYELHDLVVGPSSA